jgi:hypothetical protein
VVAATTLPYRTVVPPHGSGTRHNGALGARVGLAGLQTCGESIRAGGKLLVSAAHVFAVSGRVRVAARVHGRVRRWWADQYAWAHSAQWWRVGARVGPGGLQTCGEWVRAGGQLLVSAAHEFASVGHVRVAARVRWRVRRWSPPPLQYHGSGTRTPYWCAWVPAWVQLVSQPAGSGSACADSCWEVPRMSLHRWGACAWLLGCAGG